MADINGMKVAKDYFLDVPFKNQNGFFIKGAENLGWGMKKRLSNIFNSESGNTVMFAFDHGYFMGSVSGLERLDLIVPKVAEHVDALMATRGALRTCVLPNNNKATVLRVTSGSSVLDDDLSREIVAVDIDDSIRMDADCLAVQVFIGSEGQRESLDNLSQVINKALKYDIPVMGVVAVGKDMERTPKYFKLATRMIAELGANIIKTYYCDELEEVIAACPVPIVIAGGKKLPEKEALTLAYKSIKAGAKGVDMGRNIFQSNHPTAMAKAISLIVHKGYTDNEAYEFYLKDSEK
ncbi:3-hydroxy-5-phosphonooxypentane-2,4-dione thiolase [Cetobacterium sp. 2A]|uniref:3-hydroxy-5-phosphonooxypentane-2,4-dione thiolase n=1 Tax=unclassified Cetobacterium TaxID=2630983 RepID=UPI00163D1B6A|nr:3-hydroxy-5-phosphonooxypentane-2,4-dione thiolase [Cetobacterium sp. 2A]MBC2857317.1 3-hydroxy-5-phosphonooxypentane-2,4-dione thiolase [Cetobacterium sp. 2A]